MIDPGRLQQIFRAQHGNTPRLFRAPGRVNLIGEHTDYNDGFVLPMAIERDTVVAATPRSDRRLLVVSLNRDESTEVDLDAPPRKQRGVWADYVEGIARCVQDEVGPLGGADLMLLSDVPQGAGLSSSAALEMSIGKALLALSGRTLEPVRLARAGQRTEHEYVGAQSGIMDQTISLKAAAGKALLLDCRSLKTRAIPVTSGKAVILICDTGVRHSLAGSEYNRRRAECREGLTLLATVVPGAQALRDVSPVELAQHADLLPELLRRRCRHVVSEIDRTVAGAQALEDGDLQTFGRLMFESHRSLRDDYEVSVPELDLLVDAAARQPGVWGARMTGGGFGGSTVNLVDSGSLESVQAGLSEAFARRFGRPPDMFVTRAAAGAGEVEPS